MNKLKKLNDHYTRSEIEKPLYIKSMHDIHSILFDYSEYIKDTDIQRIEIKDDSVIMTSRTSEVSIICDESDYRIAPIEILNFKYYEKNESDMIFKICRNLISDNPIIFDIGANIGWYTVNLAKMNRNSLIYAFEPVLKTHDYLTANCIVNGVNNVKRIKLGLSDKKGEMDMFFYPEGSVNASLKNLTERDDIEKYTVDVSTIDDFVDENNTNGLDFVKCDVEGAELLVFQGGKKTILKYKPIVFTEMLRKWSAKFSYHPNEIIRLFSEISYKCFIVNEDKLVQFFSVDDDTVETNYFFLHSVEHEKLIAALT